MNTPITSAAPTLHISTGMRLGDSVKVVSAVRWLHSDVIASTPTTGNNMVIGSAIPSSNSPNSTSVLNDLTAAHTAMASDSSNTLASIVRPDRVSMVLRSSTENRRLTRCGGTVRGWGFWAGVGRAATDVFMTGLR